MHIYRHGDVCLKEINNVPNKKRKIKDKILARGEVTGHTHRFKTPQFIERYQAGDKIYLEVQQTSTLIHEEHKPLIIKKGIYEQIAEREYDPFIESARTVID